MIRFASKERWNRRWNVKFQGIQPSDIFAKTRRNLFKQKDNINAIYLVFSCFKIMKIMYCHAAHAMVLPISWQQGLGHYEYSLGEGFHIGKLPNSIGLIYNKEQILYLNYSQPRKSCAALAASILFPSLPITTRQNWITDYYKHNTRSIIVSIKTTPFCMWIVILSHWKNILFSKSDILW